MKDDRQEFENAKRQYAKAMANDNEIQKKNWELYSLADKHNYPYLWNWMGVPIIQNPSDILTMQELIWETKPDVIVETGVARGGSVLMYASILELIGNGEVIGVDIDIRAHNRDSIMNHPMSKRVVLIEGSSTDQSIIDEVKDQIGNRKKVMVVLDSNHTHQHVLDELRLYGPMVTKDQYLIVADTSVEYLPSADVRGERAWSKGDNPKTAMDEYMKECDRFVADEFINNKLLLTSTPGGYFKCVK